MEIILVLIVALIVFGPKKLPDLGKSLGNGIREFKGSISGDDAPTTSSQASIDAAPALDGERAVTPDPAAKTPA
jgi:sec-independent protein translocase protein TatA